jgi:LCP family protein required for cell wall assembly
MSKRGGRLRARRSRGGVGILIGVLVIAVVGIAFWAVAQVWGRFKGLTENIITTPVPVTGTPPPTRIVAKEPTTILLLGIDRREDGGNTLNDVNIVVHVNPVHGFASMLSIPRDTEVFIPDFGYHKINASYSLGEEHMVDAGGGPILAKRTVEAFLDMPIDYYAEVNFEGFEKIVDELGGVTVDVAFPLVDNEYPIGGHGYTRIYIPSGLQHMDGRTALRYARSRHSDPLSDIGRNERQRQVLLALQEKALNPGLVDDLILGRLDPLLEVLGDSFKTDMDVNTLIALARLAPKIGGGKISTYALDYTVLSEQAGSTNLIPDLVLVREMALEMRMDPVLRQLHEEGAWVEVRNGTWEQGLAGRTADFLRQNGFEVWDVLQDEHAGSYTHTLLLDLGDHTFTRGQLAERLSIDEENIQVEADFASDADIVIILGDDFREPGGE